MPNNLPDILWTPKKRGAPKKKVEAKPAAKKQVTMKRVLSTKIAEPAPQELRSGKMTWASVVQTTMKKPHSWRDWAARQLDTNRLK